jgi:hypothetical protein
VELPSCFLSLCSSIEPHLSSYPQALKVGVQRDIERQERKRQNKAELEQQIALRKQLEEKEQSHSTAS